MPLEWHQAFSVGHVVLDAEHRGLISCINDICSERAAADLELRRSLVETLALLTQHHFEHENEILRRVMESGSEISDDAKAVSRTAIEDHIEDHAAALTRLSAICQQIMTAGASELSRVCQVLQAWFVDHSVRHDAHVKAVFQAL